LREDVVMAKLSEIVELDEETLLGLAAAYDPSRPPEIFTKLPQLVLKRAWKQSGGNWRRCSVSEDDGVTSIVVHNNPVW
jgi:hypothetical protein